MSPTSHKPIVSGSKIAWIGLGAMGVPMATRLFKAGYILTGYNRTSHDSLSPLPFPKAKSPAQAVQEADLVILMVRDGKATRELLEGKEGVLSALVSGQFVIDMSTISPDEAKEEARLVTDRGALYFDIPVSGSVVPATRGELLLLAGGEESLRPLIEAPLKVLGKSLYWFGPAGSGMAAKLAMNLLLGTYMEALAETLQAGSILGLEKKTLAEAIIDSPLGTPFARIKVKNLLERDYTKAFSASLMKKDLDLLDKALGAASSNHPSLSVLRDLYRKVLERGQGEKDLSIVAEALRQSPGTH
ncbi:MAG: NAD(P)-dependent oxidoreductase [Leptospirillia bacterium]